MRLKGLIIVLMSSVLGSNVFAGWSSNGADFLRDQTNPWYLGPETVNYCIQVDTSYPLPKESAEDMFKESLAEWQAFFRKYGFDQMAIGDANYQLKFPDGKSRQITTQFKQASKCDASKGDLEVLFGTKNDPVKAALAQGGHHGAGLAIRSDYNHLNYRNGGYIWIDNFSSDKKKIKHMLLHEMGHIFGMKHNSVHVMDERIADWMFNASFPEKNLGDIESEYWKYNLAPGESLQLLAAPKLNRIESNNNWKSSSIIPPAIRNALRIKESSKFSANLTFLRYAIPFKTYFYKLKLEIEGDQTHEIFLQLNATSEQNYSAYSPSVFTKWQNAEGKTNFSNQYIDLNRQPRNLLGSAGINGQAFAATLNFDKGVSLKIFESTQAQWWELQ